MKRCIRGWTHGSHNFTKKNKTKFNYHQIQKISEHLENINSTRPNDISRAIRGLKYLNYWKGTEYRTLLVYTGMVVLKDILNEAAYEHFMILSCAVRILSSKEYNRYVPLARVLLIDYIEKFKHIYGKDSISSNVHNLCHVVDDVLKFGPLPNISSYPFENFFGAI